MTLVLTGASDAAMAGDETFLLVKPNFNTGDVRRFLGTVVLRTHRRKSDEVMKLVEKSNVTVREAKPDGSITWVVKLEAQSISVQGKETSVTNLPPAQIVTRSSQGKLTMTSPGGKEGADESLFFGAFASIDTLVHLFPTKPIRIGERWNVTYSNGAQRQQRGVGELVAADLTPGAETLKIKITSADVQKDPTLIMHVQTWLIVNRTTGDVIKYVETWHLGSSKEYGDSSVVLSALGSDPKDDPKGEK